MTDELLCVGEEQMAGIPRGVPPNKLSESRVITATGPINQRSMINLVNSAARVSARTTSQPGQPTTAAGC